MNLASLTTLAAILDHGSFTSAASEVGLSPSAVSLQVRQLERYFGQPLFDRSGRVVKPTPFAQQVGALARDCVARIDVLRSRPTLAVSGRWRLGSIATAQTDVLPAALRWLRQNHPALQVVLTMDDSAQLLRELKASRIDGAVLVRPADGGAGRGLAWAPIVRQAFVLLVPQHASGTARQLLASRGWIRYDPALTGGRAAARHVKRMLPGASAQMDLRSIDAIVAMVGAGLGVSVVPQPRPSLLAAHGVKAMALAQPAPVRQICFVRRAADRESRNGNAVLDALLALPT